MSDLPRRFRRNLLSSYANTASVALIALVMTPVLVNGLGQDGYGIWALVGTFALYLELLEFGFGKAAAKYVAESAALGQAARMRAAIATSFWLLLIPGFVALALGGAVALFFPEWFGVPTSLESATQVLVIVIVIDLAISIPADTFGFTLMGLQRFDLINFTLIPVAIAQAVAWAIVLAGGGGLALLGIVTVAISLVGQLARFFLARRLVQNMSLAPGGFDRSLVRPFAGLSVWYAVTDVALLALVRLDVVVVGLTLGVGAAAVYAIGQKLVFAIEQLVTPATKMFFPHSSELEAREDLPGLRRSLVSGTRISVGVTVPLGLAAAAFATPGVAAWVGPGFEDAGTVIVLLSGALIVTMLTRTGLLMLQGMGRARRPARIVAGEAVLNVGLSVLLAKTIGLEGVALATLTAACGANLFFLLPLLLREFEIRPATLLGPLARAHALPLGVCGALALALRSLEPAGLGAIASAAGVALAYASILLATGLAPSERVQLRQSLRHWRPRSMTQSP